MSVVTGMAEAIVSPLGGRPDIRKELGDQVSPATSWVGSEARNTA